MIIHYVKENYLTCLLSYLEDPLTLPEPFRLQRNVVFVIEYSEYLKYIRNNANLKLSTDTEVLKSNLERDNDAVMKSFLTDIAFAINKELYYATNYASDATVILPKFDNGITITITDLLKRTQIDPSVVKVLKNLMSQHKLYQKSMTTEHNEKLRQLSYVLLTLAINYKDGVTLPNIFWV